MKAGIVYRDCECGARHRVEYDTEDGRLVETMQCPVRGVTRTVDPIGPGELKGRRHAEPAGYKLCPLCGGKMRATSKHSCKDCMSTAHRLRIAAQKNRGAA